MESANLLEPGPLLRVCLACIVYPMPSLDSTSAVIEGVDAVGSLRRYLKHLSNDSYLQKSSQQATVRLERLTCLTNLSLIDPPLCVGVRLSSLVQLTDSHWSERVAHFCSLLFGTQRQDLGNKM
jgi:hypothetical protein